MRVELSIGDVRLLLDALKKAASRHESEARFNPRAAGPHDAQASAMRKLHGKLVEQRDRHDA